LKKIFLLVLIILGVWQIYLAQPQSTQAEIKAEAISIKDKLLTGDAMHTLSKAKAIAQSETYFFCDEREFCSQMNSIKEAQFFLDNCPNVNMDVDYDGIACEAQFH